MPSMAPVIMRARPMACRVSILSFPFLVLAEEPFPGLTRNIITVTLFVTVTR